MKKREKEIKAIIFDVGAVLELGKYSKKAIRKHHNLSVHMRIAKKLNIELDQWFDAIDSSYARSIEGKITKAKLMSIISKNLQKDKKKLEKIITKSYDVYFKKNKELFRLAHKLKKQGYKIAIFSDQWHLSKQALIRKKDTKEFDLILVSCDIGLRKPDPKFYKLLFRKLKLKPQEMVFIDNQKWNIKQGKKLGMRTILFKDNKQTIKELDKILK